MKVTSYSFIKVGGGCSINCLSICILYYLFLFTLLIEVCLSAILQFIFQ